MHVRRRAAAVIAATGLTAALLPLAAGSAQADPTGPSFGYVTSDMSGIHNSTTERLKFTTPGNLSISTTLTPSSYVNQYDVSEDGNVLLVSGQSRSEAFGPRNSTYGLTLTVRDPITSAVTTKILATRLEGNPVLTRDGTKAFWFDFDYLYRYDVPTGFLEATTRFATKTGATYDEEMRRIAVSPDGTKVAVLIAKYDKDGFLMRTRVKAATFAAGGTAFEDAVDFTPTSTYPISQTLSWNADGSAFFYARFKPDFTAETVQATTVADSDTVVAAWPDVYDVTTHGGSFYLFRDIYDGTGKYVRSEVGSSATVAAPTDWTTFPPGATSTRYRAATVVPPVLTTPTNRSTPVILFQTNGNTVSTNSPLQFSSVARYLIDPAGVRPPDSELSSRFGVLSKSTDGGKTYTKVMTTSGSKLVNVGFVANGVTTALTRNSLLRWCFEGDLYVKAACSKPVKIVVTPKVSIGTEKSGAQTRVYGKAARVGGTAQLQLRVSWGYKTVGTSAISSTGRFSFGFKTLAAGSYRVTTVADTTWGMGIKRFAL